MSVLWFIGLMVIVMALAPIIALVGAIAYGVNVAVNKAKKNGVNRPGEDENS